MKVIPHYLTAGDKKLTRRQALLHRVVQQALARILPLLRSSQEVDIVFSVNTEATIAELGIGGYTPNAHTIYISLDPKHHKFVSSLKLALPRTLAHELHHAVRWIAPGYGQTLGQALVTEGLAANFEQEVFGKNPNIWDIAVRGKKLQQLQKRAASELHSPKYSHQEWFFGSKSRIIPRWTGYALGYRIVHEYLRKHPQLKPSRLVNIRASELL